MYVEILLHARLENVTVSLPVVVESKGRHEEDLRATHLDESLCGLLEECPFTRRKKQELRRRATFTRRKKTDEEKTGATCTVRATRHAKTNDCAVFF